jgi:hypothetical protein
LFYAAGGSGGTTNTSTNSIGGRGDSPDESNNATNGVVNTGSGGGGRWGYGPYTGKNGGSGVVILRYPNTFTISNPGGGLTFTTVTVSSDKVTTFTAGTGNVSFA